MHRLCHVVWALSRYCASELCQSHVGLECRGGAWFVATQGLGWGLFSISLVCLCWLILQVVAGMAYCIRCWAIATGTVMFIAQMVRPCYLACACLVYTSGSS